MYNKQGKFNNLSAILLWQFAFLLLFAAGVAKANGASGDQEIVKICAQVLSVAYPEKDRPTASEKLELKGCDSDALYYGYVNSGDPVKARKCAYVEIGPPVSVGGPFNGAPMLMMIYANGEGVKRNLDLALRLACADNEGAAPAEYEGRIEHLFQMRQDKSTEHFDYCSDITSGMMMGFCSNRQAAIEAAKRDKQLASLMSGWTAGDKQAFQKLEAAWKTYLNAREAEIDQSGTARNAMVTDDQEALKVNFLESLANFEKGKFPKYTDNDFVKADQELNAAYKIIQSTTDDGSMGTVTKNDIKMAQRAWLKYRDAWLSFAKQKYPSVTEATWKTWLTAERTALLKGED